MSTSALRRLFAIVVVLGLWAHASFAAADAPPAPAEADESVEQTTDARTDPMTESMTEPGVQREGGIDAAPIGEGDGGEGDGVDSAQVERAPLNIPRGMGAIEAFSAFVDAYERTEERGYEGQAYRYVYDGAIYLTHAVSALVPKGVAELEERRDALMRRAELLEETRLDEDHMLLVRSTLVEATELLGAIQERRYPAYDRAVGVLITMAEQLYPDRPVGHQSEQIRALYRESSRLLMEMAGQPPGPVIAREERTRDSGTGEDSDDAIGGGPMMSEEVQRFIDFVDAGIDGEHFINGEHSVYEGLRLLTSALATMLPTGDTVLFTQHEAIAQRVENLELTDSAPGHKTSFRDTVHDLASLMAGIQQQRFPNLSASVRQVRDAADHIDADRDLAMQGERLESFFLNARRALAEMEERRQRYREDW